MQSDSRQQLIGQRLKQVLAWDNPSNKKIKHVYIQNKYMFGYGAGSAKAMFADYLTGKREIPFSLLYEIASDELIQMDIRYFIGTDDFTSKDYKEFIVNQFLIDNHVINEKYFMDEEAKFNSILSSIEISEAMVSSFSRTQKIGYLHKIKQFINEEIINCHYLTLTPSEYNEILKAESPNNPYLDLWDETDKRPIGEIICEQAFPDDIRIIQYKKALKNQRNALKEGDTAPDQKG